MTHHPYKISFEYIKANYKSIKNFGLGFIQIKMNNGLLFNVYKDKLPKFENISSPHNHQSDFMSTVLYGFIHERVYDVTNGDKPAFCGCGSDTDITETYEYHQIDLRMYQEGTTYLRTHNEFHSVTADNNTITMITEFGDVLTHAIVIGRKTHEVIPQIPEEELLEMVKEAFDEYSYNAPHGTELIILLKDKGTFQHFKQGNDPRFMMFYNVFKQDWVIIPWSYDEVSDCPEDSNRQIVLDKICLHSKS